MLLQKGAEHYGADNWTKGMPYRRTADSMIRHIFQWLAGDEEEDHLSAVVFGAMCLMTYEEEVIPEQEGRNPLDDRCRKLQGILDSILTSPPEKPKIEVMAKAKKCRTCRNAVELNSPTDQCFACRFPESLEPKQPKIVMMTDEEMKAHRSGTEKLLRSCSEQCGGLTYQTSGVCVACDMRIRMRTKNNGPG